MSERQAASRQKFSLRIAVSSFFLFNNSVPACKIVAGSRRVLPPRYSLSK